MKTVMQHDLPKSVYKDGYVAISHVWGEQTTYSADKLGINSGVEWEVPLSNTRKIDMLRKAMKKFEMEWCWFDVLCMPQGEKNQEWVNKEIPFMGDYYNGAIITLVLSDGKDQDSYVVWIHKTIEFILPLLDDLSKENMLTRVGGNVMKYFLGVFYTFIRTLWIGFMGILKHSTIRLYLEFLDFPDAWFSRLWTYQEAVMSKQIWIVRDGEFYLDISDTMKRLIMSDEKRSVNLRGDPILDLARAVRDYEEHKTSVGRMLYECRNRRCYKPQDKYYGMLGILGYRDFPVVYNIKMDKLGKKFMEYAYNRPERDVSWLAVHVKDKIGFPSSHEEELMYIGEYWREEKPGMCDIKFKRSTICINSYMVASVVHSHKLVHNITREEYIKLCNVGKGWGIVDGNIINALTGYRKSPDGECINSAFVSDKVPDNVSPIIAIKIFMTNKLRRIMAVLRLESTPELDRKILTHNSGANMMCKIVDNRTGAPMLMTITGECDVGDKIMLIPMYDIHERALGLVVDDKFRRKGICLYPKLDMLCEYISYEFPLYETPVVYNKYILIKHRVRKGLYFFCLNIFPYITLFAVLLYACIYKTRIVIYVVFLLVAVVLVTIFNMVLRLYAWITKK